MSLPPVSSVVLDKLAKVCAAFTFLLKGLIFVPTAGLLKESKELIHVICLNRAHSEYTVLC